ncbi:MAG: molybdopterin-synthase adenylyltransferase MoeB [Candidatus Competibacteraceae bacterium]|nr:molybdopterin-synthase adenylyltransferase MoeB [Candidatus Competibacteraceae bacterium]
MSESSPLLPPPLDKAACRRLQQARVLIVGLGGLGCPVALYLAGIGVGSLVLADFDRVDLSNLQRQILHPTAAIGRFKADSAAQSLAARHPHLDLSLETRPLEGEVLTQRVAQVQVVVDATDNFPTRFALNAACVARNRPLVSGAALHFQGQVTVFDPRLEASPCYRCLYDQAQEAEAETCSRSGVLAPVVGVVGAIQALEVVKVLTGIGEPLVGRLLTWNALNQRFRRLSLARDPACPVCGHRPGA